MGADRHRQRDRRQCGASAWQGPADPDQFGNLVVIEHGDGWHSAYGSLARITVKEGDPVKATERVGLVGDTSLTRKTELHFELRKAGKPVDPVDYLPARP